MLLGSLAGLNDYLGTQTDNLERMTGCPEDQTDYIIVRYQDGFVLATHEQFAVNIKTDIFDY